jgi:hypothetical protein
MIGDTVSASRAIALHCSGFGARQRGQLGEILGAGYDLVAAEQYGCNGTAGPWTGTHALTPADEAAKIIAIIDIADRKVHLIGQSYSGGVALHIRGEQAPAPTLLISENATGALARSLPHRNRRRRSHGPAVACGGRGRIDAAIAHHELTRIRSQHRRKVHEHIVAASTLIFMFLPLSVASAQVPDAIAATGEGLIATVHAEGAQVYECQAGTGVKLAWQFREPIATLLMDGKTVGRHYAGPSWELTDGSAVTGKVAGRAPGSTSKDIPLLKLEVMSQRGSGQLTGVTTIQRLNTKGGIAEGSCESAGAFLSVPYSADYTFYQRRFGNKRSMNLEKLDGYLAVSRRRSSRPTGGRTIMPPQ